MLESLVFGLPFDPIGGLALTVVLFIVSAICACFLGYIYAVINVCLPGVGIVLLTMSALVRGVPLLLLVFLSSYIPNVSTLVSGGLSLTLYSFSHVGEIQRGYLAKYPESLQKQSKAMGVGYLQNWGVLRPIWIWNNSFQALLTHWISLLKDSGALVVLGVGELTMVAKILAESTYDAQAWALILVTTSILYLSASFTLVILLKTFSNRTLSIYKV